MTDDQHGQYATYLRELADLMGLRDWRVVLSRNPPEHAQHIACATRTYGRKVVTIQLSEDFFAQDDETRRHTCVHELLHAHINMVYDVIGNVSGALGSVTYGILDGAMDDAVEIITDGIADALAPHLPLPTPPAG